MAAWTGSSEEIHTFPGGQIKPVGQLMQNLAWRPRCARASCLSIATKKLAKNV